MSRSIAFAWALVALASVLGSCRSSGAGTPDAAERPAGEIIVAGEAIPIAAPVVTWRDAGGFDAHAERCHFSPDRVLPTSPARGCDTPKRYSSRGTAGLAAATAARVAALGWDRAALEERLQHFVLHYDVCVTSTRCFEVLHDRRGLSVHFLLDVDGTIYQTLDLVHRARHAGWVNDRSIGIEIAHIGAYPPEDGSWRRFYEEDESGLRVRAPAEFAAPPGRFGPAREGIFRDTINGREVEMVDFTEEQYRSLEALVDWLAAAFPRLPRRAPRETTGAIARDEMTREQLEAFEGILGHNHITRHKTDPGPAMDWERLLAPRDRNP